MPRPDIFVIGASAGGVEALSRLFSSVPPNFPGSLFVVLHTLPGGVSQLPRILNRANSLNALHVDDSEDIRPSTVYVARPNHHLIIEQNRARSISGPRESRHRPSINTLFQSAARVYSKRVVGVILSGALDDGMIGLQSIKASGGIAIVQSPDEALFPSMPRSAMAHVDPDYVGTAHEIGEVLTELASGVRRFPATPEKDDISENTEQQVSHGVSIAGHGEVFGFFCPECGGVLNEERNGNLLQFRCHVGHIFSEHGLIQNRGEQLESALWTTLRILEERIRMASRLAEQAHARGNHLVAQRFEEQNIGAENKAELLRQVLIGGEGFQPITTLQTETAEEESVGTQAEPEDS